MKSRQKTIAFIAIILIVGFIIFIIKPKIIEMKFDRYEKQYLQSYITILDSCDIDNIQETLLTTSNEDNMNKILLALNEMNRLNPKDKFFHLVSANNNYEDLKWCYDSLEENPDKESLGNIELVISGKKSLAELTIKKRFKIINQ
ncbi:hypothetical protein SH1V18_35650 [Vallitalea longa]|uniref:Uncharacterized protein n=1 Tax=Vallitalea longa TaxID=2936439 RepID=A0A9W5YEL1_9FIRM|nr:hypothetical protein [Vallitalea longa]GKX31085.1 hypothetical protein SH1V18_35650 [Vallitalea longa]